jgi:hypothetical protein
LAAAGVGAVPDPEPAIPVSAQTANTTGTNPPSTVDPPGIPTNLALHDAAIASQAAPKTSADRLAVWQMTTGLVRMFAKSDNKRLITTALLFLLMLHLAEFFFALALLPLASEIDRLIS